MTTQTVEAIQLKLDAQSTNKKIRILKKFTVATVDTFYCIGGVVYPGQAKWVSTVNTNTASAQAVAVASAMNIVTHGHY